MANKPVIGTAVCPNCGYPNVVIWDGNLKFPCLFCRKEFIVKRQKLKNAKHVRVTRISEEGYDGRDT